MFTISTTIWLDPGCNFLYRGNYIQNMSRNLWPQLRYLPVMTGVLFHSKTICTVVFSYKLRSLIIRQIDEIYITRLSVSVSL